MKLKKDRLKEIFEIQRNFNRNFFNETTSTQRERQTETKEIVLNIMSELYEVLKELHYKRHRKYYDDIREDKITEEIIDVLKYAFNLAIIWKIDDTKFFEEFKRKSLVVTQRFKQEMQLNLIKSKHVVGVDLDDVLCCWVDGFLEFIELKTEKSFKNLKFTNLNSTLITLLGEEKFKQLKHEFRLSDRKKKLKAIEYASEFTNELKKLKYTIIILSSRPVDEYPKLYGDTIEWLNKNKIMFDALFFNENKNNEILKKFPSMKFFVEDSVEYANSIASRGYKVFLLNKDYNKDNLTHKNVIRVENLKNIIETFKYKE